MNLRLFVSTGLLATTLFAQTRFDLKVRNYFFAGFSGDAESLQKGMKMCEATLATEPKNAEALVWHGAGVYYEAGQSFQKGDQQKGMQQFQQGIKEMDQAVEMAPDSIGVRIPRGAVLLTGSRFTPPDAAKPLVEKGVSDFQKSYDIQKDTLDQLGTHPKGELLLGLADGYGRLGDDDQAHKFYAMILSTMPGTPYAKKATNWMDTKASQTACLGCHTGK